jgi:hypothetical protein
VLDIRVPGTNGNKLYLCHNPGNSGTYQTLEVSVNAVTQFYQPGADYRLGSCEQEVCGGSIVQSRSGAGQTLARPVQGRFEFIALSNPTNGNFRLKVLSQGKDPVTISIVNSLGQVVYKESGIAPNSIIVAGKEFTEGVYYAEARQGGNVKVLKLIRTK